MKKFVFALILATAVSSAAAIAVDSGGIVLGAVDVTTVGSGADPWLISEKMTGPGTLVIRDFDAGNTSGTFHSRGKWFSKTVFNDTGVAWTSFELELQVILGTPSGPGDGLSFADADPLRFTFSSDKFAAYTRIDTTRDYLNFSKGFVGVGETVTFNFIISDNSSNNPFYLLQTPNLTDVPEPSSWALLAAGLVLGAARIRAKLR
jgi:hypothetical protein